MHDLTTICDAADARQRTARHKAAEDQEHRATFVAEARKFIDGPTLEVLRGMAAYLSSRGHVARALIQIDPYGANLHITLPKTARKARTELEAAAFVVDDRHQKINIRRHEMPSHYLALAELDREIVERLALEGVETVLADR
jgi:hypothetical protein